jgi:hypothetical protein
MRRLGQDVSSADEIGIALVIAGDTSKRLFRAVAPIVLTTSGTCSGGSRASTAMMGAAAMTMLYRLRGVLVFLPLGSVRLMLRRPCNPTQSFRADTEPGILTNARRIRPRPSWHCLCGTKPRDRSHEAARTLSVGSQRCPSLAAMICFFLLAGILL